MTQLSISTIRALQNIARVYLDTEDKRRRKVAEERENRLTQEGRNDQ